MTTIKKRAEQIVSRLQHFYPDTRCTLDFKSAWQLLVAAILAAQCTDARVNQITPALFARYPDLPSLAAADYEELAGLVHSCGLYRSKAKAIIGSSRMLLDHYEGEMPADMSELTALPGVGRKIANLIRGDFFQIPAVVVDTHCARISQRLGLTRRSDPAGIEKDLEKILQPAVWIEYGHLMVRHGREICQARRPACPDCPVCDLCPTGQAQE